MKYLFKVIAAACAMGLTAVSAQAETDLSFAVLINPPGPEFEALDFFVKRVEELSKGDLKISVFPGGQLGNTRENIEQLGVGQVALALHGDELISGLVPEYSAVITPFVFPSTEAVFDFWRSDAGKAAIAQIETRGGIRVIGIMRRGQRQLTANKPIPAPADLAGLKLRIPEIASWIEIWSTLGAKPTPVTFTEVFGALQMGVIGGQENPCIIIDQAKLHEVQDYLMMTSHLPVAWYWGMSKKVYDTLTETQREVLMKAAAEAAELGDTRTATLEKEACDRLVSERGMTLVTPDREAFKKAVIPAIETLSKSWSPDMKKYLEDNLK
ncbi:TRAP transporter substrate-binding protein [Chelativorans sp. AA-79]|uniref:TRAP transporter substrate-binding protein n=1 Tax=Chelativorans sp. AA-79 TaxID=3028735 RepID=UPI0023F99C73|nr:TRAP transporter substrate-binding protein [Chelativorans sp. AA-79]WEX12067.1 TRAP transporter substrate-binding protein [Chelativorans sp. AA-79]